VRLEEFGELRDGTGTVLCAHAFCASADADFDHAALDGVGDIDTGLQAGGALSVQRFDGCCGWEAGGEGSGTEFGCATSWGEDGTDGDVFDEVGVDAGALEERFVGPVEEV